MNESAFIKHYINLIEDKLAWGNSKEWTKSNFEKLSQMISTDTRISISADTLKRVFGKNNYNELYNPQPATKRALAIFLGFTDWEDFRLKNAGLLNLELHAFSQEKSTRSKPCLNAGEVSKLKLSNIILKKNRRIMAICFLVILILSAAIFLWPTRNNGRPVKFSTTYTLKKAPYTVVFNYDVSNVKSDSIFIDFGDDIKTRLEKSNKVITHYYELPNYYKCRLIIDGKVAGDVPVHLTSQKWVCIVTNDIFTYPMINAIIKDGEMRLHKKDLYSVTQDSLGKYNIKFRNIKAYPLNADKFVVETRIKNSAIKDNKLFCPHIVFKITGEYYSIKVNLGRDGCFADLEMQFGEKILNGTFSDLSAFTEDKAEWKVLKIEVKNKHIKVFLNKKLIFGTPYTRSLGRIMGLSYHCSYDAQVDYVRLYNLNNELIEAHEFNDENLNELATQKMR